jgi:hypothetical protein
MPLTQEIELTHSQQMSEPALEMPRKHKVQQGDHPTRMVVIKKARVDVEMIPLVNWLNAFDSITTQYCCQGDPPQIDPDTDEQFTDDIHRPYVLFVCIEMVDLVLVLDVFRHNAIMEVHWNETKNQLEYCARFYDKPALYRTIERIGIRAASLPFA